MPGYVMHMAEARRITDRLGSRMDLSEQWVEAFITGALLPDTKLREQKKESHFWNPDHLDRLALGPDLDLFLEKYSDRLENPLMLGYLAHLHLDQRYVDSFWPTAFRFLDQDGREEYRRQLITDVEVRHLNQKIPVSLFFTPDYYYGEYSKLNAYFIRTYHLTIPEWESLGQYADEFSMDEVDLKDMAMVCRDLRELLTRYSFGSEADLKVFELDQLEAFIADSAEVFLEKYMHLKE